MEIRKFPKGNDLSIRIEIVDCYLAERQLYPILPTDSIVLLWE